MQLSNFNKNIIIKRYKLDDILANQKILYNVNNIWENNVRPLDYEDMLNKTKTGEWIHFFHDNIKTFEFKAGWLMEAIEIGCLTKRFPEMFEDELENTLSKINITLEGSYFIRTEHNSLKYGQYGTGPYKTVKNIIQSIVTSTYNHPAFKDSDETCKIYLMPWIENFDDEKEFRVFVYNNEITSISIQNLFKINHWLNSKSKDELELIINSMLKYFALHIRDKLIKINNYTMDIYFISLEEWYFIEPNNFGKTYAAGSSLFHWVKDEDLLCGKTDTIELRYVSEY